MANIGGLDSNSRRTLSALSNAGDGTIVNLWADPITHRLLVSATSTANLIVGTSTISNGTNTYIEYNNNGVLGEYSITGSGTVVVMQTSPTLITPALGVATATSLAIGGATIGSNGLAVTGHLLLEGVTSTGATGTGLLVFGTSPTLITPTLGVATATSYNGLTITSTTGTFTLTNAKTLTVSDSTTLATSAITLGNGKILTLSNTLTLAGTDSTTMTFPSTSASIARSDAGQTFTGTQTFSQVVTTANTVTVSSNAGTVPVTSQVNNFTNSSASAMTITLTTTNAVDGQVSIVRIFDASASAKGITWVNTENSANVTAPANSAGSTTIPLTVGFRFNSGTTKWTCLAFS